MEKTKSNGELMEDGSRWPRLMSVKIAAKYTSLSARTIYNALCKKASKPFPVKPKHYGKRVLFLKDDLGRWIDTLDQVSIGGAKRP